mmetsp:Transcript_80971/g.262384  ORF Transcript_80971/g.262384 Transcript_80971/m.262384 type:complete len:100 (+) Transcript_80971:79-378(+)
MGARVVVVNVVDVSVTVGDVAVVEVDVGVCVADAVVVEVENVAVVDVDVTVEVVEGAAAGSVAEVLESEKPGCEMSLLRAGAPLEGQVHNGSPSSKPLD